MALEADIVLLLHISLSGPGGAEVKQIRLPSTTHADTFRHITSAIRIPTLERSVCHPHCNTVNATVSTIRVNQFLHDVPIGGLASLTNQASATATYVFYLYELEMVVIDEW